MSFHRSGASWAFQHGVLIEAIANQGTWSSDCVWQYIHTGSDPVSGPLLQALKSYLSIDGCLGKFLLINMSNFHLFIINKKIKGMSS